MNKHTFTPGQRVRVFPTGETGTVTEMTARFADLHGFISVHFDGDHSARPCAAANLIVIDAGPQHPQGIDSPAAEIDDREHEALRKFRSNYRARTIEDLERVAKGIGMNVLEFFKLVHPAQAVTK